MHLAKVWAEFSRALYLKWPPPLYDNVWISHSLFIKSCNLSIRTYFLLRRQIMTNLSMIDENFTQDPRWPPLKSDIYKENSGFMY